MPTTDLCEPGAMRLERGGRGGHRRGARAHRVRRAVPQEGLNMIILMCIDYCCCCAVRTRVRRPPVCGVWACGRGGCAPAEVSLGSNLYGDVGYLRPTHIYREISNSTFTNTREN